MIFSIIVSARASRACVTNRPLVVVVASFLSFPTSKFELVWNSVTEQMHYTHHRLSKKGAAKTSSISHVLAEENKLQSVPSSCRRRRRNGKSPPYFDFFFFFYLKKNKNNSNATRDAAAAEKLFGT